MAADGSGRRRRWPALFPSLRARLTLLACLAVAAALLLGSLVVLSVLEHTLVENLDDAALGRARDVASELEAGVLVDPLPVHGDEDAFVQVVDGEGDIVTESSNLRGIGRVASFEPEGDDPAFRTQRIPVPDETDESFRIVGLRADSPIRGPAVVYVVANLDRVVETSAAVRRLLTTGLPVLLLVVAVTSWVLIGRVLRPVEAIRAEVSAIGAQDLDRRVPEPGTDDEIGRLARTMNDMLGRLQASAERQRRFVADASHELQSPLATSRAELDVALAHPELARWEDTARDLVADNQRMSRLVADLLFLAQADDGAHAQRTLLLDLDDVVAREAARHRSAGRVRLDTSGVTPVEVRGDPDQLARVVRNLLDNAERHATSTIRVTLVPEEGDAVLAVADDGPGVPAGAEEQIFERFTRVDRSRSRDSGGTGLGLAIAKEIAEGHQGTIELDRTAPGARFVVRLPRAG
jgi:signal transduction histidine kinase